MSADASTAAPSFAICTLGCKINQYDSNRIAQAMCSYGFRQVAFADHADVYIVDTCTVTHVADQKSRNMVSRAIRRNPDAIVAVTGCAPEWNKDPFLRLHRDAIVAGNARKAELPALINDAFRRKRGQVQSNGARATRRPEGVRARAVLKVMEGCNRACSFCIVPRVRGKPYSRPFEELIDEARGMVRAGAREIVITGVIAGWYGTDLPPLDGQSSAGSRRQLHRVVRALQELDGLARIRLSTIDPRDLTSELISAMAECDRVTPYLNLALQSGSDAVLVGMRRGYTTERYEECVLGLRAALPEIGLHTDIMVGFPGETDGLFDETVAFVKRMDFSSMHVFPFSPRPGTAAPGLPGQVSCETAARRAKLLTRLSNEMKARFGDRFVGRVVEILVERCDRNGNALGLTGNYIPVQVRTRVEPRPGDLLRVLADRWDGRRLVGVVAPDS